MQHLRVVGVEISGMHATRLPGARGGSIRGRQHSCVWPRDCPRSRGDSRPMPKCSGLSTEVQRRRHSSVGWVCPTSERLKNARMQPQAWTSELARTGRLGAPAYFIVLRAERTKAASACLPVVNQSAASPLRLQRRRADPIERLRPEGFVPARAGKTQNCSSAIPRTGVHPCTRRGDLVINSETTIITDLSLHIQGRHVRHRRRPTHPRFILAHTGETANR